MALYKKETDGTTKLLAGGTMRQWVGTQERYEEVKDTIPNNTMIIITDEESEYENDIPIGTILQYKGDTAPNGYLFTDGSTFDENVYPALYNLLGSNELPEKYAEYDSWSEHVNAVRGIVTFTAEHDGQLYAVCGSTTSGNYKGITIKDTTEDQTSIYGQAYNIQFWQGGTADIKKGHTYSITFRDDANTTTANIGYYCYRYKTVEPYVIKALDAAATADFNTQQTENILNAVDNKIQSQEAMSTTNDLTITRVSGTYNGVKTFYKRVQGNFVERWIWLNYTGPNCVASDYTTLLSMVLPSNETLLTFYGNYENGAKHVLTHTTGGDIRLYNTNASNTFQPVNLYFYITSVQEN